MVDILRTSLRHVKEYCEEAAIHGPQHIVSPRLAIFERLALITPIENKLSYIPLYHTFQYINISFSWQDNMVLHIHRWSRIWLPALHSVFREMVLFTCIYGCWLIKLWCSQNTISGYNNLLKQQNCWAAIGKRAINPTLEGTD